MGESKNGSLRVSFDRKLKLEFQGVEVTSDAGLLAYRELDEALGLSKLAETRLRDTRTGKNVRHRVGALFRQSVFSRLGGYEDVNDSDRLRFDPAMRAIVGARAFNRGAASCSEMAQFETQMLVTEENFRALETLSGEWIQRVHEQVGLPRLPGDMDSSEKPGAPRAGGPRV